MGFFDRLFGRNDEQAGYRQQSVPAGSAAPRSEDEIALERYRYLLRTAPPEKIEQVHAEAFAQLTPQQRQALFQQLTASAPAGEAPRGDDPNALAQAATRSELRAPGTLERALGTGSARGGGPGFGTILGGSLLGTVAGYVLGSAIVSAFLPQIGAESAEVAGAEDASAESAVDETASADGGGFGDFGSDFGGGFGDFGGGEF